MSNDWKIYTRKGDQGNTTLIGGTVVPKNHIRVDAYGTVDELNAFTGLLFEKMTDDSLRHFLLGVMNQLFLIESHLATDPGAQRKTSFPDVSPNEILGIENEIDRLNNDLPTLTRFILPAGCEVASLAHICRTVCRRAERTILSLNETSTVAPEILQYMNRLSDYFFVLARWLSHQCGSGDVQWIAGA